MTAFSPRRPYVDYTPDDPAHPFHSCTEDGGIQTPDYVTELYDNAQNSGPCDVCNTRAMLIEDMAGLAVCRD